MTTDPTSLAPREKAFADHVIGGMPAGRAYEKAGYKAKGASADSLASKMLRKDKVSAYIKAERKALADLCRMEKWELITFLCDVVQTPVGSVDETSVLAQEVTTDELAEKLIRKKIKMVGKLDAAKLLASLLGWNAPEKVEHTATSELAELIRLTRSTA